MSGGRALGGLAAPAGLAALALAAALVAGCATAPRARPGDNQRGVASWYGPGFHGKRTANGEVYDMHALTAAHKTLPFDTFVRVRNRDNGRRVVVRINDRGPFVRGRIIDLSRAAAERIDMIGSGTARVEITVVRGKRAGRRAASPTTGWVVQAGAYRDPAAAEHRARLLAPFGPSRVAVEAGLHKVLLGPWPKKKQAQRTARRLREAGFEGFVRDEPPR